MIARLLSYTGLVLVLCGCAAAGLQPAQGFNDRLGYALATHTAVLQSTTAAVTAGAIQSSEAERIAKLADESRALLDTARVVHAAGDVQGADSRLALATAILQKLQAYLQERQS